MFNPTLLTKIDALKARLDRIRPLAPDLVTLRPLLVESLLTACNEG
jgi:hypothetical protein